MPLVENACQCSARRQMLHRKHRWADFLDWSPCAPPDQRKWDAPRQYDDIEFRLKRTGKRSALRRGVRRCFQDDVSSVDNDFPGIFEIHRDQVQGYGLDLSNSPVRLGGIDHEFAGFQKSVHDMHCCRPIDLPCREPSPKSATGGYCHEQDMEGQP